MQANPNLEQVLGMFCVLIGVALVVGLTILIFYLLTLQKALSRVSPRNRLMEPAMVWLLLVPCLNIVWQFMVAVRLPDSLRNEFRDRGQDDGSDYGKTIAVTNAILGIVYAVVSRVLTISHNNPLAGGVISLGLGTVELALFIIFWVKIASYSARLAANEGRPRDLDRLLDDFDDDDDGGGGADRPSPDSFRAGDPGHYQ